MAMNPLGAVQVFDFGLPKVISVYAREVISGGQFVTGSTATDVVSSGASSFASSDLKVSLGGSGTDVTGIALANAASGAVVPVALEGIFILPCNGTIVAGETIEAAGADSIATGVVAGTVIGRSLTAGASGGFTVAHLRF